MSFPRLDYIALFILVVLSGVMFTEFAYASGESIALDTVKLELWIKCGCPSGSKLAGVHVTGMDASNTPFDVTTDRSGYAVVYGTPGLWQFTASKEGFKTNSWTMQVAKDDIRYPYLLNDNTNWISKVDTSGRLSKHELARLVMEKFPEEDVPGKEGESVRATAYAVARAESGGNPTAWGDRELGDSIGLWQINLCWHPEYSASELFDPDYNANAALEISKNGLDWTPWSTWKDDTYKGYLEEGRDELNQLSGIRSDVTLNLYVHDGSASGPIIQGAQVIGHDGSGNRFVVTCDAVDETIIKTGPNSEFYVEVLLVNPSDIGGKYLIVSESSLKESIVASIPEGFKWGNAKVDYKLEKPEIDISEPISESMFLVGVIQKAISISMGQIPVDPLTSIELLGYATGTPTTPSEIVASIGNKMIESKRLDDIMVFDYRMRNYGFWSLSGKFTGYRTRFNDGILIPPSTTLILEIPLKAPPSNGEYYIDLNIPYWYTTTSVPNPSIWDGRHIDQKTTTITKVIVVEKNKVLEGSWEGKYYYSDGRAPVKFSADITQNGNEFSGKTQETNTFGDPSAPLLFANIKGSMAGDLVTFVKTYDGTGNVRHSVDYSGTLDIKTKKIAGTWTVRSATGTFDMSFV